MLGAIIGILASKNNGANEFFTSILYPIVVDEALSVSLGNIQRSSLLGFEVLDVANINIPTLMSGTLDETITYKSYNEIISAEPLNVNIPTLMSGSLDTTISYINYNTPAEAAIDIVSVNIPTLVSGTLQ